MEAKKKDLELKLMQKGNTTIQIKNAINEYALQKKEMNLLRKQEQELNLNKHRRA